MTATNLRVVAYIVLNGFSLVYSMASICAVTFGPLLLISWRVASWRQQVVKVGLFHLAVSLASLMAAFAAAGFIAAGKWAPDLNCGKVLCSEGGVSCSAFAYERNVTIAVHNPAVRKEPYVSSYLHRTLSPRVAKLNEDRFGNASKVTCQDHSYIASLPRVAAAHPENSW